VKTLHNLERYRRQPRDQAGTALVMSLVILMILTMIGIAAMNTSSFEERMAGNIQEGTHAFEAAESGLNRSLNLPGALVLTTTTDNTYTFGITTVTQARVITAPTGMSPPKRGSGYSSTSFDAANFDQQSTGTVGTATSVVNRGIAQIVPK
jgi:Tfp pilus assembly protein PilX